MDYSWPLSAKSKIVISPFSAPLLMMQKLFIFGKRVDMTEIVITTSISTLLKDSKVKCYVT